MKNILEYLEFLGLVIVVGLAAYFKGKYYTQRTPVGMPDNSKQLQQAQQHESAANEAEQKAKQHAKAGDQEAKQGKQHEQAGNEKSQSAQEIRDKAVALEEEIKKKKERLATLEKPQDTKIPQTIEELNDEFK